MLASIVGRGRFRGGTRFAAAAGVAAVALAAISTTALAATYSFSNAALPQSPFHLVVGDQLTLSSSPPVLPSPPPGMVYVGTPTPHPLTTDNPAVLATISSSVGASGVVVDTFQAVHSGTAHVEGVSAPPCLMSIPSTTTTTVTSTITASSTTTTQTSTSTRTAASSGECAISEGPVLTVIVDASVQGASTTVPAAGAASVPWPGVGLLFAGMGVVTAVLARRDTRNRR